MDNKINALDMDVLDTEKKGGGGWNWAVEFFYIWFYYLHATPVNYAFLFRIVTRLINNFSTDDTEDAPGRH